MPTTYAIPNGATVFNATLFTGTGAGGLAVNNASNGSNGFYPDLIWIKSRNAAYYNTLLDYPRGASVRLFSNLTDAESNNGCQSSFNTNGFTLNADSGGVNNSGTTYVAWQWNAGSGTTSSNTSGSITSTVDANPTAGFSVVTYTSTTGTVGHGLGVAPSMIIMKGRNVSDQWTVGHASLNGGSSPWNYGLPLNDSATTQTNSGFWNNTAPTSTVFSQGSWDSGYTKVAYCFVAVAGFSAFGTYTGNGSTDGPFIYTGFRPRFLMIKNTSNVQPWIIVDTSRNPYNQAGDYLQPSSSGAENALSSVATATADDILSNGFKLRNSASSSGYTNASGNVYIYAAFAETPFKYANAR